MKPLVNSNKLWHPIWFVSLSLLLVFIILPLVRQGMFLDGVFYAAIAKNLSIGHGTLWQPHYSQTEHQIFYDHPPLAIYFQSLFFKLFRQDYGVERLYSFLMGLGQFSIIAYYWLKTEKAKFIHLGLLLFLWTIIPLNHLYTCNMLEGTLTLFTTIATLLLLHKTSTKLTFSLQYLASAMAILIAFLCNGPTAFFPIAVPFIQKINEGKRNIIAGLKATLIFVLFLLVVFVIFYFLVPDALINTKHYLHQQLLAAIVGDRDIKYPGLSHFHAVSLYFRAYWIASIVAISCICIAAKITKKDMLYTIKNQLKNKQFQLFLLLSLIASLPVGLSHKQAFNYIMQSAPLFSIAIISLCFEPAKNIADYFKTKIEQFNTLYRLSYSLLLLCIITVIYLANGYNRNEVMIKDIKKISFYIANDALISTSPSIFYQWAPSAYFARYSMISVTPDLGNSYYLSLKNEPIPENYHLVYLPLSGYKLAILDRDNVN